jgi:hypothetical protein
MLTDPYVKMNLVWHMKAMTNRGYIKKHLSMLQ